MNIEILEHEQARDAGFLINLAGEIFDDFDPAYIRHRLPHIVDPVLVAAHDGLGPAGFKLGYRDGTNFYSWLGGVHPRARRKGLAGRLMQIQHDHLPTLGFENVTTRTRASNRPMIILNLKFGFEIIGFEVNNAGFAVVNQRKSLVETNLRFDD